MRVAAGRSPSAAATDVRRSISALGSRTSAHMDGRAADIHVRGMSPVSVAQAIVNADIELDQLIYEGAWVHVGIEKPGSRRAVTS